jgi:hypothetical protein
MLCLIIIYGIKDFYIWRPKESLKTAASGALAEWIKSLNRKVAEKGKGKSILARTVAFASPALRLAALVAAASVTGEALRPAKS